MSARLLPGPFPAAGPDADYRMGPGLPAPSPSRRWRLFVIVFVLVAAAGLAANYLRPAIYRSGATLLVEAPASQSRPGQMNLGEDAAGNVVLAAPNRSAQILATEQQRLLATPLLQALAEEFGNDLDAHEGAVDPLAALQAMTRVGFDPATSLLDVAIEGREPALLLRVLERWLVLYEETRASSSARTRDTDDQSLREQLTALEAKIAAQRAQVDAFRAKHGIVSEERADNAHAAKLKGLNDSINDAADDEMRAAARLDAIRAAIAAGKPVADGQNLNAIERLQEKVETLRDMVRAHDDQFTEKYAQIAPEIVAARKDLAQAERDLEDMRERAKAEVLSDAETELATARESKLALMQQQRDLRGELTEFSQRFDELASLRTRLAELEAQAAPLRERLVQTEVAAADLAPRVSVLAAPSLPSKPVRPAYARDAAIAVATAFVLALLATVLVEFLTRPAPGAVSALPPQQIYSLNTQLFPPAGGALALPGSGMPETMAPIASLPAPLAAPRQRELAPEEVVALLRAADARARLLVALLLSGVAGPEIAGLRAADLSPEGRLAVGTPARTLPLARAVQAWWHSLATEPDLPVFNLQGAPLTAGDLEGTLIYVAHDAGLARPEEVGADALRHTYFAWLVRCGLKLGDLPRVGGPLAPALIATYAPLAPPGAGRALEQMDVCYPVLAQLA